MKTRFDISGPSTKLFAFALFGASLTFALGSDLAGDEPPLWEPPVNPHREPARAVFFEHCGPCHHSDLDTALEAALWVYDLAEPEFTARMTNEALESALRRFEERPEATLKERAIIDAFVRRELRLRESLLTR